MAKLAHIIGGTMTNSKQETKPASAEELAQGQAHEPQFSKDGKNKLETQERSSELTIWKFLNSPFGLFLFSSILIAGITRVYNDSHQAAETRAIRNAEILK